MNLKIMITEIIPTWVIVTCMIVTFILFLIALLKLRRRQMNDIARLLWVLFLLIIPFFGSIIFFLVHPGELPDEIREHT
jgi:uncharacterized membrane protein YhaH (DUF805 family)